GIEGKTVEKRKCASKRTQRTRLRHRRYQYLRDAGLPQRKHSGSDDACERSSRELQHLPIDCGVSGDPERNYFAQDDSDCIAHAGRYQPNSRCVRSSSRETRKRNLSEDRCRENRRRERGAIVHRSPISSNPNLLDMKRMLFVFAVAITAFSCKKEA